MQRFKVGIFSIFSFLVVVGIGYLYKATALLLCGIVGFHSLTCSGQLLRRTNTAVAMQSSAAAVVLDETLQAQSPSQVRTQSWTLEFSRYQAQSYGSQVRCSISGQEKTKLVQSGDSLNGRIPWAWCDGGGCQEGYATISGTFQGSQVTMRLAPPSFGGFEKTFSGTASGTGAYSGSITPLGICSGGPIGSFQLTSDSPVTQTPRKNLTFELSSVRQISADAVEVYVESTGGEGCRFITTMRKQGNRVYQESMRFVPSSPAACGLSAFNVQYQADGNGFRIDSQSVKGSREVLTIQILRNGSARATYQGDFGQSSTTFSNPSLSSISSGSPSTGNASRSATAQLCELGRGICTLISELSKAVTFWSAGVLGLKAGLAGPALSAAARGAAFIASADIMVKALSVGFIANFTCWMVFDKEGSLPPLPFVDKIFKFTRDLPKAPGGTYGEFTYDFVGATSGDSFDQKIAAMRSKVRKALGLDICDEATDTSSEEAPVCVPCRASRNRHGIQLTCPDPPYALKYNGLGNNINWCECQHRQLIRGRDRCPVPQPLPSL